MKVIFFGTTDFAVASLDQLIKDGVDIVGVVTTPDKPGGRGLKEMISSEIYKYASGKNLKIYQPKNLKSPIFLKKINKLNADLFIVVAFRMMPAILWEIPKLGTINLHGSLLPAYRGAAPINWAIINGEKVTGITIFFLDKKIDTGKVIHQKEVEISEEDNFGSLYDKLKHIGANELSKITVNLLNGPLEGIKQNENLVSHAPKLNKENTEIDFNKNAFQIVNLCRGLDPYPTAWFTFDGLKMKVFRCTESFEHVNNAQWESDYKTFLRMSCANGAVNLEDVQMEGKKRMLIKEFLNGYGQKLKKLQMNNLSDT